jgi:hypothetical protein
MRSSSTITLFSERPEVSQPPFTFMASILAHGAVISVLSFGILFTPAINVRVLTERYDVRQLDLHALEPRLRRTAGTGVYYPGPYPTARAHVPGGKPVVRLAALRQIAQAVPGPQTLVQPDIHSHPMLVHEMPVPTVMIWSGKNTPVKTIVAPKPETPTAADVRPSPDLPNEAVNLADMRISPTELATEKLAILPSTTSPLVVHAPVLPQLAPATASNSSAQPTPAAVMSLSDLHMPEGTVTLPPVNMTAPSAAPGTLAPHQPEDPSQAGNGSPAGRADKTGAGQGSGDKENKTDPGGGAGKKDGTKAGTAQGAGNDPVQGDQPSAQVITLPKNGQFSAVVVGSSLKEKYPETAQLESGRLAYTVYLHVGLAKNWILQYWLPRSADAEAAGDVARLEAPWPYNILRPNIAPGAIDADALMIHGFVNQTGRFEALAVAFPPGFAQTQFVLDSLAQWQFRPATQNGQNVKVEVLLIIPDESE